MSLQPNFRASKAASKEGRILSVSARRLAKKRLLRIGWRTREVIARTVMQEALQQTYENAKVEISELRRVEAQYHELRSHAGLVAKDKESLSVAFQTLKQEHAALRKDDEQTKKRLEFEAINNEDLTAELSSARVELTRLEERCAALAGAQGPINELTEKLMNQQRDRDEQAIAHSQAEDLAKVLDCRLRESQRENYRLGEALIDIQTVATTTDTEEKVLLEEHQQQLQGEHQEHKRDMKRSDKLVLWRCRQRRRRRR